MKTTRRAGLESTPRPGLGAPLDIFINVLKLIIFRRRSFSVRARTGGGLKQTHGTAEEGRANFG
ncbi:MAG: hypothetical protein AMJ79_10195 [Phycisphaerae bacterium SM23_30]|nr:MAG: hypothetical protein AMJ79_10195 [Phycisphaerae bacterium SM23_30]